MCCNQWKGAPRNIKYFCPFRCRWYCIYSTVSCAVVCNINVGSSVYMYHIFLNLSQLKKRRKIISQWMELLGEPLLTLQGWAQMRIQIIVLSASTHSAASLLQLRRTVSTSSVSTASLNGPRWVWFNLVWAKEESPLLQSILNVWSINVRSVFAMHLWWSKIA